MDSADPLTIQLERLREARTPTLIVRPEQDRQPGSVALLSGSFDPMTVAHAALAQEASQRVDLVLLLYSVQTLPKEGDAPPALLPELERIEILERFCSRSSRIAVGLSSHGLLAEQVAAAKAMFPDGQVWLVMGSDKVLQILDPKWYEDRDDVLGELFDRAGVLYADRSGEEGQVEAVIEAPGNVRWRDRFARLDIPPDVASISSRLVRDRLGAGDDVSRLVVPEARPYLAGR
jgi:nicotinamide-nucleotide adenylyltransferase